MQLQPVDHFIDLVRRQAPADLPGARIRDLGLASDGEQFMAVSVPGTPERAVVLGYPHPSEPLAQIAWAALVQTMRQRQQIGGDGSWLIVPVWDAAGARLAERAWAGGDPSVRALAANWVRPAPSLQVEWSFPVDLGEERFDAPRPETAAVREVLTEMSPQFLFSLHNALFPDGYALVSDGLADCESNLGRALDEEQMGRRHPCPIPYVPVFGQGVYGLPGVRREQAYLTSLGHRSQQAIGHGAASFDVCPASLSCVLELPLLSWRTAAIRDWDDTVPLAEAESGLWELLYDMCERLPQARQPGQEPDAAYLLSSPRYFGDMARSSGIRPAGVPVTPPQIPRRELASRVCTSVFTIASNIAMLQRGYGMPVVFPDRVSEALSRIDRMVAWRDPQSLARCLAHCMAVVLSTQHPGPEEE
ncbi:MAG TPA: hypothetical protein VGH27_07405 [Streptosporangiaceae bacterium]|jgi:hypothetical protein